jgi:hypothetical protein
VTHPADGDALGSVLELERALEAEQAASVDGEARLRSARTEAAAILAAARERAEQQASERRASLLAEVEAETRRIAADADAAAEGLRAAAAASEEAFVDRALAIVLPGSPREAA